MYYCNINELNELWKTTKIKNKYARDLTVQSNKDLYSNVLYYITERIKNNLFKDNTTIDWIGAISRICKIPREEVLEIYEKSPLWVPEELSKSPRYINDGPIRDYCMVSPLYCLAVLDFFRENEDACIVACNGRKKMYTDEDKDKTKIWKRDLIEFIASVGGEKSPEVIFAAARIDDSLLDLNIDYINVDTEEYEDPFPKNFEKAKKMYNTYQKAQQGKLSESQFEEIMSSYNWGYFAEALDEAYYSALCGPESEKYHH